MRRADRLFQIVQALRGRRAITARRLASDLGVVTRTIYRDVADLQLAGVPIEGAAGVGYALRKGSDVPPLMFTRAELEALVVGARFAEAFAGRRLADAARQALQKIEAVLPEELRRRQERSRILAPRTRGRATVQRRLDELHAAIDERRVIALRYAKEDGGATDRDVEPLCLAFWGRSWTLGAYCRLRQGFRNFRVDRMESLKAKDEIAPIDSTRDLRAYLKAMGASDELEV